MQQPVATSPFRRHVDRLAQLMAKGLIDSQGRIEAQFLRMAIQLRGWDLAALSSSGPLAALSDTQLAVLLDALARRIDDVFADYEGQPLRTEEDFDADLEELRAALSGS